MRNYPLFFFGKRGIIYLVVHKILREIIELFFIPQKNCFVFLVGELGLDNSVASFL